MLTLTWRISWLTLSWPYFKSFLQYFERNKALTSSFKKEFTCLTYLKGTRNIHAQTQREKHSLQSVQALPFLQLWTQQQVKCSCQSLHPLIYQTHTVCFKSLKKNQTKHTTKCCQTMVLVTQFWNWQAEEVTWEQKGFSQWAGAALERWIGLKATREIDREDSRKKNIGLNLVA